MPLLLLALLGMRMLAWAVPAREPTAALVQPSSGRRPADLMPVREASYTPLAGLAAGSQAAQAAQRAAVSVLALPLEGQSAKSGIVFRLIPAGTFVMGSPTAEQTTLVAAGAKAAWFADESRQHSVTLTNAYYCSKYPITQRQWERVMGGLPAHVESAGQDTAVEQVSWDDCQDFLAKLCALEAVPAGTYRLLTEAEWEYACRAGTGTATYVATGAGASDPESRCCTAAAGQTGANAYGLYDMNGRVWQWCNDWYGDYPAAAVTDPAGAAPGRARVFRGGGQAVGDFQYRSAHRNRHPPAMTCANLGLRVLRLVPGQ